ncbi:hypothetical protein SpCBS45565_g04827 [Spizellomyces sp. 'palustris']|nr:hypothetical protein SpCBS45565_g04827 [Spizellomyces sp. 'palustris']
MAARDPSPFNHHLGLFNDACTPPHTTPPSSRPVVIPRTPPNLKPPRLTLSLSHPTSQQIQPTHETIQQTWAAFDAMSEAQRNMLLKGLVARCGGKQVEGLCTWLSLRMVDSSSPTVYPENVSSKYATAVHKSKRIPAKGASLAAVPAESTSAKTSVLDTARQLAGFTGFKKEMKLPQIDRGKSRVATEEDDDSFFPSAHALSNPTPNLAQDGGFAGHHLHSADRPHNININLYTKLLHTHQDADTLAKQLLRAGPEPTRTFIHFLSNRLQKSQHLITSITEIAMEPDTEKAMNDLLNHLLNTVDARYATVYLLEDTIPETTVVRASNWAQVGTTVSLQNIFNGPTLQKLGQPSNAYNVKTSEQYTDDIQDAYASVNPDCILSAPILDNEGRFAGILELINKSTPTPFFESEDESVVKLVASLWTVLMKRSQILLEQTQQTADIRAFLNTASVMTSEIDLGDLIKVIMQTSQELLKAERCSLFMVDKEKQELWTTVAQGTEEIRIPINKGIAGHVAMTGTLLNIPNAYKDHRFNRSVDLKTGYRTRNILCMPMKNSSGSVIGVTQIINKLPESAVFSREDEMLGMSFAGLAGGMLEKSLQFKALQIQLQSTTTERDLLNTAFQNTPHIILALDHAGRLLTVNDAAPLGLPDLSLLRLTTYDTWLSPNDVLITDIKATYETNRPAYAEGYVFRTEDGASVDVNYAVVKMESGVIIDVEVVGDDRRLAADLGRYMHLGLVREVQTDHASLHGKKSQMSVLVAELREFASITDNFPPSSVITLLNEHHSSVYTSISSENGLLQTQTGPTTLSLFGLPHCSPTDAVRCVSCALKIKESILERNEKSTVKMEVGIGIATGDMVWGLVGHPKRRDVVGVGDPLHLSTHLRTIIKTYTSKTSILICESTKEAVQEHFHLRELDAISWGDKPDTPPMVIYEVLHPSTIELDKNVMTSLICYELGLSDYRSRNFGTALNHFRKAVQMTQDEPSKTMVARCRQVLDGRVVVPQEWDSIWRWDG